MAQSEVVTLDRNRECLTCGHTMKAGTRALRIPTKVEGKFNYGHCDPATECKSIQSTKPAGFIRLSGTSAAFGLDERGE